MAQVAGVACATPQKLWALLISPGSAKYSCAQEIALVSARTGFKIDNDFMVEILKNYSLEQAVEANSSLNYFAKKHLLSESAE